MKEQDNVISIAREDRPDPVDKRPAILNIEKVLEDHLPSEIKGLEDDINSSIESLMKKEAKLTRLKLLNRIINNDF